MNTKRRLTGAERALIEKMTLELPRAAFKHARPRVVVKDELDEQGRVEWTTSVPLDEMLPNA